MKEIRILPAVLHDVAEAAAWYDEKGYAGLGERFIATFYASLPKIQRDGEIYRTVHGEFRRVWIRPFPYAVFFRLHRDTWDCESCDSCSSQARPRPEPVARKRMNSGWRRIPSKAQHHIQQS